MIKSKRSIVCLFTTLAVALSLAAGLTFRDASGQVRAGRHGVAVKGEEGKGAAVGRRGAVVKGDEGYAAVGRRGGVAHLAGAVRGVLDVHPARRPERLDADGDPDRLSGDASARCHAG